MAYLNKEAYARKKEYAVAKMERNVKITSLSEEQHDALRELCSFRHNLHCNWEDVFYSESLNAAEIEREISIWSDYEDHDDNTIRCRIYNLFGIYPFNRKDYATEDAIAPEDDNTEDYMYSADEREAAIEQAYRCFNEINTEIESFLRGIDEQNGTEYCPSGFSRI